MRVCLMIEGQEGVTWDQWRALATTAEASGFEALFRSDHYQSLGGNGNQGSLDAWATINALATLTSTIRLGTLVSPATFRHPSTLAREVVTADHASNGRVELGLGAGWNEGEHRAHGFPFDTTKDRFDRLEEQFEIVRRSWDDEPFDFNGSFYRLQNADPRPKPLQPRLHVIAGGSAKPRGAALAARFADEYNTVYATVEECRERKQRIAEACAQQGRDPIPLSLMTSFALDGDPADHHPAWLVGTTDQIVQQIQTLEASGVERIMLQHLEHHDLEVVERIGREIIPAVS